MAVQLYQTSNLYLSSSIVPQLCQDLLSSKTSNFGTDLSFEQQFSIEDWDSFCQNLDKVSTLQDKSYSGSQKSKSKANDDPLDIKTNDGEVIIPYYFLGITLKQWNLLWGLQALLMMINNRLLTDDYSTEITTYCSSNGYSDSLCNTYFKSTNPINVWKRIRWLIYLFYVPGFFLWFVNTIIDNDGKSVHTVFYRFTQACLPIPLVIAASAIEAKNSYPTCGSVGYYRYCLSDDTATYGASGQNKIDDNRMRNFYLLFLNSIISTSIIGLSFLPLARLYELKTGACQDSDGETVGCPWITDAEKVAQAEKNERDGKTGGSAQQQANEQRDNEFEQTTSSETQNRGF